MNTPDPASLRRTTDLARRRVDALAPLLAALVLAAAPILTEQIARADAGVDAGEEGEDEGDAGDEGEGEGEEEEELPYVPGESGNQCGTAGTAPAPGGAAAYLAVGAAVVGGFLLHRRSRRRPD